MEQELVKIKCGNCHNMFQAQKPQTGEAVKIKCPHCGHEAMLKLNPVKIRLNVSNNATARTQRTTQKNVHPEIGEAHPIKNMQGKYKITKQAVVGQLYKVPCPNPECDFSVIRKPTKTGWHKSVCPKCGSTVYYEVIDESTKQGAGKANTATTGQQNAETSGDASTIMIDPRKRQTSLGQLTWGRFPKQHYALHLGINTIGRKDPELPSDVQINDKYASRRSASIHVTHDDIKGYLFKFTVDKATNPVYVDSTEVKVGESIYLSYGQIIKLGNTALTFKKIEKK